MKIQILLVIVLGLVSAFNPGATGSLDFGVAKQAKNVWFSKVVEIINGVKIPNVDIPKHGWLRTNTFHLDVTANQVDLNPVAASNAVKFTVNGLKAKFHSSDLRYKELIVVARGSVDASCTVKLDLTLQLTQQTVGNKVVPAFKVLSTNVDLPNISVSIHGNLISKIANAFKTFFMGTVKKEIIN